MALRGWVWTPSPDSASRSYHLDVPSAPTRRSHRRPTTVRRTSAGLLLASLALLLGFFDTPAGAHSGKQSYVYISMYDSSMEGRVELPARDIEPILGFAIPEGQAPAEAAVEEHYAELVAYVDDHLTIGDGIEDWDLRFEDFGVLVTRNGTYVQLPFLIERDFGGAPPRTFVVDYSAIIEANPEKDALLLIEHDWSSATFANEGNDLLGFSVGRTEQTVVVDEVGTLESVATLLDLGVIAVRTLLEHLLIVVAIVLPTGLVAQGRHWSSGAPSAADAYRRAVRLIGTLLVANLAGMWLVGLGAVDLPDRFVSVAVVLALLAAAGWAVLGAVRPAIVRAERVVVAAIGVVLGFGLGDLFIASGLDRSRRLLSLISYSLGVELALVVMAGLAFAALLFLGRTRAAPATLFGGAAVLSAFAVAWIGERLANDDWPIERVSTPIVWWPRSLFLMLLVVALCAGLAAWSSSSGRLRPVVSDDVAVDDLEVTAPV